MMIVCEKKKEKKRVWKVSRHPSEADMHVRFRLRALSSSSSSSSNPFSYIGMGWRILEPSSARPETEIT